MHGGFFPQSLGQRARRRGPARGGDRGAFISQAFLPCARTRRDVWGHGGLGRKASKLRVRRTKPGLHRAGATRQVSGKEPRNTEVSPLLIPGGCFLYLAHKGRHEPPHLSSWARRGGPESQFAAPTEDRGPYLCGVSSPPRGVRNSSWCARKGLPILLATQNESSVLRRVGTVVKLCWNELLATDR